MLFSQRVRVFAVFSNFSITKPQVRGGVENGARTSAKFSTDFAPIWGIYARIRYIFSEHRNGGIMTDGRIQRLVIRYQQTEDVNERDRLFATILREVERMPVCRAARRKTYQQVAGHSPRFADEEQQAIREGLYRALRRYDATYGMPAVMYISRYLKGAIRDYWRRYAQREDLPVAVPVTKWAAYRGIIYRHGEEPRKEWIAAAGLDELDFDVCRHGAYRPLARGRGGFKSLYDNGLYETFEDDLLDDLDEGYDDER